MRRGFWLALAVFIALFDLATKQWAITSLIGSPPIELTSFLRFVYAENTGVAFGFFAGGGEAVRYLLLGFTVIISVILAVMLWRANRPIEFAAWALMLGGAVGNFIDRLWLGYVVDFIDVHLAGYHWPAFNIADIAINVGALLVVIILFKPLRSGG